MVNVNAPRGDERHTDSKRRVLQFSIRTKLTHAVFKLNVLIAVRHLATLDWNGGVRPCTSLGREFRGLNCISGHCSRWKAISIHPIVNFGLCRLIHTSETTSRGNDFSPLPTWFSLSSLPQSRSNSADWAGFRDRAWLFFVFPALR